MYNKMLIIAEKLNPKHLTTEKIFVKIGILAIVPSPALIVSLTNTFCFMLLLLNHTAQNTGKLFQWYAIILKQYCCLKALSKFMLFILKSILLD